MTKAAQGKQNWPRALSMLLCALVLVLVSVWHFVTYALPWWEFGPTFNRSWDAYSESLVLGRIYQMQISADDKNPYGLLGHFQARAGEEDYARTRRAYLEDGGVENDAFLPYTSSLGLQGTVQGYLNLGLCALRLSANDRYMALRFWNIFLFVAVLMLACAWLKKEMGLCAAAAAFVCAMLSPWSGRAAMNLYWAFWMFFALFALSAFSCRALHARGRWSKPMLVGLAVLLVCRFACGFEFTSTALVAIEMPVLYYACRAGGQWRKWVKPFLVLAAIGVGAFAGVLLLWIFVLGLLQGGFSGAWQTALGTVAGRTGFLAQDAPVYAGKATGLDTPLFEILQTYCLSGEVLQNVSMGLITVLYLALLCILLCTARRAGNAWTGGFLRGHLQLLCAVLLSYLAPLSWFVLAKGHAAIHPHIDYILWFFPTMLFVAGHAGRCAADLYRLLEAEKRKVDTPGDI